MLLVRDGSRDAQLLPEAWGKALKVLAVASFAVVLLSIVAGHFLFHGKLILITACVALSDSLFARTVEMAGQAFQSRNLLAWTCSMNTLIGMSRLMAAALLAANMHMSGGPPGLLLWTLFYTGFTGLSAALAVVIVHTRLVRPSWARVRSAELGEGAGFAFSGSSYSIYNDIDKTMLTSYGFLQAAGSYAAAYRVIEVATAPIRALYNAALPKIFACGAHGPRESLGLAVRLLNISAAYGVAAAVGLWLAAPYVPLLLGKSFAGTVAVIRILLFLPLLRCFHYSSGNAISGCASQWYRTLAQIAAAAMNLCLNLALIPHWTWKGAAISSLITDAALGAMNWATLLYLYQQSRKKLELQATFPAA
jgi:O-antigen/teichoic acid export membrane protein